MYDVLIVVVSCACANRLCSSQ